MNKRIGLTGTIGSGKSTASEILFSLGAEIVDADKISRVLTAPGGEGLASVYEAFGTEMQNEDGSLNRKKLAALVFSNERERARLNAILHPMIFERMLKEAERLEKMHPNALIIFDVPLLFECGFQAGLEKTLLITAPEKDCIKRLMRRDGMTEAEAQMRIRSQMPVEQKRALADTVIENNGTLAELWQKLTAWYAGEMPSAQ